MMTKKARMTMPKYIDADKIGWHPEEWCGITRWIALLDEVEEMPAEDVAPIVHARWDGMDSDGDADGNPV